MVIVMPPLWLRTYLARIINNYNMKSVRILLLVLWILALHANILLAQSFALKTYEVAVRGTSSLHDWESTVDKLEAKGSFTITNNIIADLRDVVVKIPVKAIKSTKGKMMDNKTWEAFNHEKHPYITFLLTGSKINAAKNIVNATGTLTMAGVTKTIDLSFIYILTGGELQITGSKQLLMTDYKMEPPTAMMGTIKVGDQVEVDFQFVLIPNNTL